MRKGTAICIGIMLGVFVLWVGRLGAFWERLTDVTKCVNDTIYTILYDTVTYRQPIPYDSTVIRYVNRTLTTNKIVVDTIKVETSDTIPTTAVSVSIPITQKVYKDSTYEAWVSGYEAKLDSINVLNRTTTNTITSTITNTIYQTQKTKRWGIGVQAGGGLGIYGFTPYIGIGIQYNIFTW